MAEVYASLIIKGLRTINEVPTQIKEDVKAILIKKMDIMIQLKKENNYHVEFKRI